MTISQTILLRPLSVEDAEAAARLHALVDDSPYSANQWKKELLNPYARGLGLWRGQHLAGYGLLWLVAHESTLHTMGVEKPLQGRGYGALLMLAMLGWSLRNGAVKFMLESRAGNTAALALYERLGFQKKGVRRGYYRDGEDAVLLSTPPLLSPDYRHHLMLEQQELEEKLGPVAHHPWVSAFTPQEMPTDGAD